MATFLSIIPIPFTSPPITLAIFVGLLTALQWVLHALSPVIFI